jgi:hypothetical protein
MTKNYLGNIYSLNRSILLYALCSALTACKCAFPLLPFYRLDDDNYWDIYTYITVLLTTCTLRVSRAPSPGLLPCHGWETCVVACTAKLCYFGRVTLASSVEG